MWVLVILAMVWGYAQLDKQGWFDNPVDKIPSIEINR